MTSEITDILFQALCACLEISPSASASSALIRRAYQDPEPSPEPPRDHNAIYYDLIPETAPDAGYAVYSNENPQASGAADPGGDRCAVPQPGGPGNPAADPGNTGARKPPGGY